VRSIKHPADDNEEFYVDGDDFWLLEKAAPPQEDSADQEAPGVFL
jgi:hypothetical protein